MTRIPTHLVTSLVLAVAHGAPAVAQEPALGASAQTSAPADVEARLVSRLASCEAWRARDTGPSVRATALAALIDDGQTATRGDHAPVVRKAFTGLWRTFPRQGACTLEPGAEHDATVAQALEVFASIAIFDRPPGTSRHAALVANELVARQKGGLWGAVDARFPATMQALLALKGARDLGLAQGADALEESAKSAIETLGATADAKTGIYAAAKLEAGQDVPASALARTAAMVTAKLLHGADPSADALLARSIEAVRRAVVEPPKSLDTLSAREWEWLLLGAVQVAGTSKEVHALSRRAHECLAEDIGALFAAEEWTEDQALEAAAIVGAHSAPWRYAPVLSR